MKFISNNLSSFERYFYTVSVLVVDYNLFCTLCVNILSDV